MGLRGRERAKLNSQLAAVAPPSLAFLDQQREQLGQYFSEMWQRTRAGFSGIWHNWGEVREINEKRKKGLQVSMSDVCLLHREKKDTAKLIRMLAIYAVSPSILPYYLIFWPGALPSTFDLPKHRDRKYEELAAARIAGLLTGIVDLEKECENDKNPESAKQALTVKSGALKALGAGSWRKAFDSTAKWVFYNATALGDKKQHRADFGDVPPALIKGAAIAMNAGFSFLPAFVLKFPIKGHISDVISADEELSKQGEKGVAELSKHDLLDLCLERGIGHPTWSRQQLQTGILKWSKQIDELSKTLPAPDKDSEWKVCPYRLRLALMGLHAVSSAREISEGELTRAIYTGNKRLSHLGF